MAVLGLESRWKAHDIPTILALIKLANVGHVEGGIIIIIIIKTILEESQNYFNLSHYNRATFLRKYERKKKVFKHQK